DALLRPRADAGQAVADRGAGLQLLGHQHRPAADGDPEPAAGRADADVGGGRARDVVRPLGRVPPDADDERPALAAGARGPPLRPGRAGDGLVQARPADGALLPPGSPGSPGGPANPAAGAGRGFVSTPRLQLPSGVLTWNSRRENR